MADVAFSRQTWLFQLKCRLFRFKCCYFCWNVGTIFALFVQSRPMLTKTLAIFLARKRATLGSKFSQFSPPQSSKSAKCQFFHQKNPLKSYLIASCHAPVDAPWSAPFSGLWNRLQSAKLHMSRCLTRASFWWILCTKGRHFAKKISRKTFCFEIHLVQNLISLSALIFFSLGHDFSNVVAKPKSETKTIIVEFHKIHLQQAIFGRS